MYFCHYEVTWVTTESELFFHYLRLTYSEIQQRSISWPNGQALQLKYSIMSQIWVGALWLYLISSGLQSSRIRPEVILGGFSEVVLPWLSWRWFMAALLSEFWCMEKWQNANWLAGTSILFLLQIYYSTTKLPFSLSYTTEKQYIDHKVGDTWVKKKWLLHPRNLLFLVLPPLLRAYTINNPKVKCYFQLQQIPVHIGSYQSPYVNVENK